MTEEQSLKMIGFLPGESFDLEEATSLINYEVVRSTDEHLLPTPPHEKVGFIVGVIWMNDEIEILIRIEEKVAQLTKAEYLDSFILVPGQ